MKTLTLVLVSLLGINAARADASDDDLPEAYDLVLPIADRFCVPVRSTFAESMRTVSVVRGRRIRHRRNGGFGLAIEKLGGPNHLLHTGADLGWWQVREPVFAIAVGIVRLSSGPKFKRTDDETAEADAAHRGQLPWGNLIVIEHRLGESTYATSVYGHLGGDRRVKVGDRVKAGQPIGTIGRKHFRINGGYAPHLHFGIRKGRNAEPGRVIFDQTNGWRSEPVVMSEIGPQQIELSSETPVTARWNLTLNNRSLQIQFIDGRATAPTNMLWVWQRPGFAIEGYAITTDGWYDPIQFLRDRRAAESPERLRRATR